MKKIIMPFDHIDYITYAMVNDNNCPLRDTFNSNEPHTIEELKDMVEELAENIADWDVVIKDQLNRNLSNYDRECLKSDRQSRQQSVVELRLVKKQLKEMMNNNSKEYIAV